MMEKQQYNKSRIGIIGTAGLPAQYGGFETMTEQLVLQLANELDITVYCSGTEASNPPLKSWKGAKLIYIPLKANGVQSIFYDLLSMLHALLFTDVLLVLGVSGCAFLPFIKLFSQKKVVVNIDGMEWKRAKWGLLAKYFLKFSERMAIHFADEVITDNRAIQDYVYKQYGRKTNMIAYGGDQTQTIALTNKLKKEYPFLHVPYAFKVCRIVPENNVELILEAFATQHISIVVVGNWNSTAYGKTLREQYSRYDHLHLLDPIYDPNVLDQMRCNCMLYIHGHSAGGTNPSLVEAMNLGLPILAYDVIYNRETTMNKALFFNSKDSLSRLVDTIDLQSINTIGSNMSQIAKKYYTWDRIARQYAATLIPDEAPSWRPSLALSRKG